LEGKSIEIIASDGSPKAIEKAKHGIYRERSFRNLSPGLRIKYFAQDGKEWKVDRRLHDKIRWKTANLMDETQIREMSTSPFIFCRNVFIYFSDQTIQKTVERLYDRMPKPGFLFIAASESLLKLRTRFELEEIGGAFVYVKK
ncbi:MAG: CheR family methyltransferase, partial [Thermodesulfobacteriota bacterium]